MEQDTFEEARNFHYRKAEIIYGSFGRRFVAFVIDALVLVIPFSILGTVLSMPIFGIWDSDHATFSWVVYYLARVVVGWLYFALLESSDRNGTIGKIAVDLKVLDKYEETITFDRASLRYFCKIFSALILFVGFLMSRWTEKKQSLHDLACGTIVIYAGPETIIHM